MRGTASFDEVLALLDLGRAAKDMVVMQAKRQRRNPLTQVRGQLVEAAHDERHAPLIYWRGQLICTEPGVPPVPTVIE